MKTRAKPASVVKHLKGMSYPAGRGDLVKHAKSRNAPKHVMRVLQQLPDRQYVSASDLEQFLALE